MIQNVVVFRFPPIEHTSDLGEYILFHYTLLFGYLF